MRKIYTAIISLLLLILISACGCNNSSSQNPPVEPTTGSTEPFEQSSDEAPSEETTDELFVMSNARPYCVMIDNDSNDSRPHAGLEDAYIVYEMYVEGKATRLMAVFKGTSTPKIGPVRSSRHYFLDYALDNDALYSHAG